MNPATKDDDLKNFLRLEGLRTLTRPKRNPDENVPFPESLQPPMNQPAPAIYPIEDVRANPTLSDLLAQPPGPEPMPELPTSKIEPAPGTYDKLRSIGHGLEHPGIFSSAEQIKASKGPGEIVPKNEQALPPPETAPAKIASKFERRDENKPAIPAPEKLAAKFEKPEMSAVDQEQENQRKIREAQDQAGKQKPKTLYDAFKQNPDIITKIEDYAGAPMDQNTMNTIAALDADLKGQESELDQIGGEYKAIVQELKDRLAKGEETEADKYMIGLTLLAPLLIGAFGGKEAGIGALIGGASSLAREGEERKATKKEQEAEIKELTGARLKIEELRSKMQIATSKRKSEVLKNMPEDVRNQYKNREMVTFKNPLTGKEESGIELAPDIYVDEKHLREDPKTKLEQATKFQESLAGTRHLLSNLDKAAQIYAQIGDRDLLTKAFHNIMSGKDERYIQQFADKQVYVDGKKMSARAALESLLSEFETSYKQANNFTGALTEALKHHMGRFLSNPWESYYDTPAFLDQITLLNDRFAEEVANKAKTYGFLELPIQLQIEGYQEKQRNRLRALTNTEKEKKILG